MASNYERILKKRNSEGKSFSSPSSVSNYDRVRFANIGDEEAEVRKKLNSVYDGWQSAEDMASYKKSVSDMYDKLSEYRNLGNGSADLDNLLGAYSDALNSWDDISNIYAQYGNADAYNIKKRESDWVNQNKGLSYDEVQRRLQTASGDEKNYLNRYGIIAGYNSIDDYDKDLANREKPNNILKAIDSTSSVTNKVLDMVGGNDTTYEELSTARNLYAADHAFDKYQTLENNADFAEKSQTFSTDKINNGNGKVAYAPLLNKMTDEEKAVANYISNTNPSQLETYLRDIQMMVERRSYEETQGKLNKVADNPLGAIGLTAASYATNLVSEPFMMLEEMRGLAGLPYSPYSGAAELNTLSQGVRSHISENIAEHGVLGKIGSFGYNVANSTIDSALGAYVLGKIGMGVTGTPAGAELFSKSLSVLMGSGAFNSAYKDGIERGLSEDQAMIIGFANGLNEAIFEEISLDRLVREKDLDSLGKAIKNVFTQAGVEGSEEVATDIANMLSEQVILGKQSEISEQKRQLMAYGYSEQEAEVQILKEKSLQTLESFLAGAASGGLSTLGYSAMNRSGYSANKKIGETIRNNQRIDDLSEFADKATTTNSNSIQYGAKEYKDSLSTKYEGDLSKATDGELGVLYKKARNDAYEAYAVQKQNDLRASAEEMLIAKGETEAKAKAMADSIAKDLVGEKLDSDDKNVLKIDIVKEVRDDIKENGTKEDSELLTESIADMKGLSEYAFRKEGTIKDAEILDNGKVEITNADGSVETVKTSKLDARTRELIGVADDYSGKVREMFLSNYNGQNTSLYTSAFDLIEKSAEAGTQLDDNTIETLSKIIPIEQIKDIYKEATIIGAKDMEARREAFDKARKSFEKQFTKGTFNTSIARESLNNREKALYDIAEAFSELGMNITLIKDPSKNKDGMFSARENTVYINLAARYYKGGQINTGYVVTAMSHEFTHWMEHQDRINGHEKDGMYHMIETLVRRDLGEERWAKFIKDEQDKHRKNHKDEIEFKEMSYENASSEVVARACENMLNDTEAMARVLKDADETEVGRFRGAIKEFFDSIHAILQRILGTTESGSEIAKIIEDMDGEMERLRNVWIKGFEQALEYNQHFDKVLDDAGLMTDGNYVYADDMNSQQTFAESDYATNTDAVAKEIADKLGVDGEVAKQYIKDVGGVAKYIRQHSALLDYTSVEGKSAWVSNPEYGGSLDYSFLCPKRLTYTGTMNAIRDALDRKKKDIAFSVTDFLFLRSSLKANGYESPCSFCFVESARMRFDKYNKKFINNAIKEGLEYIPKFSELNNPDKLEKMRYEHKETYDAYIKYMNTLSQRKPKMLEERRAYDGDILKAFSDKSATKDGKTIEYKNLRGGIRFNSFSDFEVVHMIDSMQAILDMSRVGLAGFGYTKQKGFAEVFGNTGLKINLSCVAKGVSADGMHIVFDDYEGMNSKDAIELRNKFSKNVGVCCVVFTDEQLKAALCDERIDYVLPFHRSQWSSADYAKLGLPERTKDFTKAQTEKGPDGKRLKEGNTPFLSYWDFNKSGKENVQNYLDEVINNDTKNAVKPLFADVLTQNADGTWSMYKAKDSSKEEMIKEKASDNYWKLLTEFKLYDNEGNPSPQNPVRPTFEMDAANNLLKTYDGSHTAFPVADNVVDEFLKYKEDGIIPQGDEFDGFRDAKKDKVTVMYVKEGETQIDKKTGKLKLSPKQFKAENVGDAIDIALEKGLDVDIDATYERQEYDDLNSEQEDRDALDIASEYIDIASEYDDYGTLDATDYAMDEMISPIAYNIVDGKISEYIDGLRVVIDDEEADESLKARAEKLIKRLKGFGSTLYSEQEGWGNGYDGYSMSNNARYAYENGEKPLSKWSKADIIDAISAIDPNKAEMLKKVKLATLKDKFLAKTSWHHTSEYYNKTDFYSINENAVGTLTDSEIRKLVTAKETKAQGREFRGDITYLEWSGTRNHPKATEHKLTDVNIEERGSFYIVTDDNGKELIRKKIGSNGTRITDYEAEEKARQREIAKQNEIKQNSSAEAYAMYQDLMSKGHETSMSGNIYPSGRKPSRYDYNVGIENFFKKGEQILTPNVKGGYDISTWNGSEWETDGGTLYSEQEDETYNDYRKASNEVDKQYAKLTNDVRRLEAMLKLDKTKTLDPAQLRRTAQELIEETESDLSVNEVISALKETYDYILQLPNHRDDARFERTIEMAKKAAKKILTEQSNKNIDAFSKEVLQHIRKSRVKFDDAQKAEAINLYGGNYRNAFMGKIVIVKDGIELDSWWQDMAENYPGLFKSDVNSADMPTELINIVDKLKSVKVDGEVREVSDDDIQYVAERIYAKFWDGFVSRSDLYDARLKQIMDEHEAQIDAIKKSQSQYLESKINYYREQQMMSNKDYIANKVAEEKAKMQDAALRKATIDKITKNAVDLANWIKSPNTKSGNYNRVPEALRGPVSEVIKAIDFSSKQMLGMTSRTLHAGTPTQKDISIAQALSHLYDVMADANTDKVDLNTYLDLPPMFISELKALVTQVNDIQRKIGKDNAYVLNQMTSEQLQNLLNTVKTVRKAVTDFNKLLANANGHSVDSVAYKTIEYAKRLGQRKWSDGLFKDFFAYGQALPFYAFKRFGEGGQEMFAELQDGWDKFAYNARDIKNFVEKTYKPKEVRDWNNEVHTFTILEPKEDGTGSQERELKLTTAQIMSLYCLSKREQAKGHLLGGGIVPTDIETHDGKFNTTQKISQPNAVRITDESLNKILETLTDRQIEVADALQKFMAKECADWGNEITMKRFGILGFTEENYFPIKSDSNIIGGGMRENEKSIYALLNMSFTKALTQGANNQIMIDDIFRVFTVHASDMAKYNALALPVLDMIKWWNYKEKHKDGRVDNSTRVSLESAFGKASNKYINNFLSDLNGNTESHRGEDLQRSMLSRYKRAAVAANLQVALLQPLSYIRAYNAMDRRYLNKALRNVLEIKQGMEESKEHSGITIWKDFGFFNTDISRGLDSLFRQDGTWLQKAVDKSMAPAGFMDSVTWGIIWNACKYEVEATTKLQKGSDDYYKAINDKMRDIIYRTQVIDSTMTRSDTMRSTNSLAQLGSAFASEPTISYNVVMDKVSDMVMDTKLVGKGEAFKRHGKDLAKAMNIYLISACVESALRLVISHYRGNAPEDEEVWRDYGKRVLEELNPLTKIPYIKRLWEVAENTLNRRQSAGMDEQFVVSTIQAFQSVAKAIDEGWTYKTTYNTLRAVSQLSGLPLGSALTEMVSLWNLIFGNMFPDLKITK